MPSVGGVITRVIWMPVVVLVVLLALSGLSGCRNERFALAPVSGRITLDGEPLAHARVGFEPIRPVGEGWEAGPGSYATTNEQGQFELVALTGKKGAVIGKHRVWIRTMQAKEGKDGAFSVSQRERLPKRYNDETELEYTVNQGGTTEAIFALRSK